MTVDDARSAWRRQLAGDDVNAAITAMANLLNVEESGLSPEPEDVDATIATIARLGPAGRSAMEEHFMSLAARIPEVSAPVLLDRIEDDPLGQDGGLATAALAEAVVRHGTDHPAFDRDRAVAALAQAVDAAAGRDPRAGAEALSALHEWWLREPVPEAGPAVARWLERAVEQEEPHPTLIRRARQMLERSDQAPALARIRERAAERGAEDRLLEALGA